LVYETQRRWMIWQAALTHGAQAAAPANFGSKGERAIAVPTDDAAVRERLLNEVLDAINTLDENAGLAGARKVILNLRTKTRALATEKA
jgi:hypothetical protein